MATALCGEAVAADTDVKPSVSLVERYSDNVWLTTHPTSDFVTNVTPALRFSYATDRVQAVAKVALRGELYASSSRLNAVSQFYDESLSFHLTPLIDLSAGAQYARDTTLDMELRDRSLLLTRTFRRRWSFSPAAEVRLSPCDSLSLACQYEAERFDSPNLSDYSTYSTNLGLSHMLAGGRTTLRVDAGYAVQDYTNADTKEYSAQIGLSHALSETLTLDLSGGPRYADSRSTFLVRQFFDPETEEFHTELDLPDPHSDEWRAVVEVGPDGNLVHKRVPMTFRTSGVSWLFQGSVRKQFTLGDANLGYARQMIASGFGQTLNQDRVTAGGRLQLTRMGSVFWNGTYSRVQPEIERPGVKASELYETTQGLSWTLSRHLSASLSYSYLRKNEAGDTQIQRHQGIFSFDAAM
ncbi:MAG: hypothetical protein V2A77_05310 [Pseudomonadota bacterium]